MQEQHNIIFSNYTIVNIKLPGVPEIINSGITCRSQAQLKKVQEVGSTNTWLISPRTLQKTSFLVSSLENQWGDLNESKKYRFRHHKEHSQNCCQCTCRSILYYLQDLFTTSFLSSTYQVKDLLQETRRQRTYIITQIQTELLTAFSFLEGQCLYFFPFPTTVPQKTATEKTGLKW